MNQRNRTSNRLGIFIIILAVVVPLILELGYVGLTVIYNATPGVAFGGPPARKMKPKTHVRVFHVEPQIIYQLDKHRYVMIENYESCEATREDNSYARAYYYDTKRDIKTALSVNVRNYIGRIINADPTGKNIVLVGAPGELYVSERGNGALWAAYSTDYGRTFSYYYFGYATSPRPIQDSEDYTVVITDKELAVYDNPGYRDVYVRILDLTEKDEQGKYLKRSESRLSLPNYSVLMDRYQCNREIKGEIELIPIDEYKQKYGDKHE